MNKKHFGILCITVGVICIIIAGYTFVHHWYENSIAFEKSNELYEKLVESIESEDNNIQTDNTINYYNQIINIDEFDCIGYISIPNLELDLPVISEFSYYNLTISPCRYSGSLITHNLVIAAHNYLCHFGYLQNMNIGDRVYFTDVNNVCHEYSVAAIEVVSPEMVEKVIAGEYDLTLFTCTYSGEHRVVVRCNLISDK